jgi:hypothetical protein
MEPQPRVPGCKELESVPQLSLVPVNSVHIRSRDCKLSLASHAEIASDYPGRFFAQRSLTI